MKHKILLILVVIIFILSQIGVNYLIYKSENDAQLSKLKLKNQKNTFAIMLEQDDGSYKETSSTSFNQPWYTFNSEKSNCIDMNGNNVNNALKYDNNIKAVGVTSNQTVYCYMYFDKKLIGASELITLASADEVAYDGTVDNNLRYIGKDPNNYIYFNCSDHNNPTASTCEKWRIIGAFNNMQTGAGETQTLYKIIRSGSLGNYYWDYKQTGVGTSDNNSGSNDWEDSQLMLMLNGVSLGNYKSGYTINGNYLLDKNNIRIMNISGSYYEGSSTAYIPAETSTSGYSSTTTEDFSSKGLKNGTTRGMIENVVWKLGGPSNFDTSTSELASHWYSDERGTKVYSGRPTEWTGKIGLIYPSDYGYATSGGATTNRETCLATALYNWSSDSFSDCRNNDWLFISPAQWTITPDAGTSFLVFDAYKTGIVRPNGVKYSYYVVRPSVYLTSNIVINGGEGSSVSPYTIKVSVD